MTRLSVPTALILGPVLLLWSSAPAWACSVCFGASGGNLQRGFFWGILLLLLLPVILFGTIAGLIIRSVRKKTAAQTTAPHAV